MIAPGDRFRVTAAFQYSDLDSFQNVWWIRVGGSGTATDADLVTAVKNALVTLYQNIDLYMSSSCTLDYVLIDRMDWFTDHWEVVETMYMGPWETGLAFTVASALLPRMACALHVLYPAIRRHSGRKFYGGFTEDHNDAGGTLNAALIAGLAALAADILVSYSIPNGSCDFDFVIPNMSGNATNIPTSILTDSTWHRQGRRQPNVGI